MKGDRSLWHAVDEYTREEPIDDDEIEAQYACPAEPTPTVEAAPHFVAVYWRHFWNGQRMTRTHLFRDYPERGYQNVSPSEGRSLCGEHIPDYYHEQTALDGPTICKRCARVRTRLLQSA